MNLDAQIAQRIAEHDSNVTIALAVHFVSAVPTDTTPEEFSLRVEMITDSSLLSVEQKISILAPILRDRWNFLTPDVAKKYFLINHDEVLLKRFLSRFEELPTAVGAYHMLSKNSLEVRIIRVLLKAMKIMLSPQTRKSFARLVLRKFPNLPGYDRKTEESHGVRRHLENIAFGCRSARAPVPPRLIIKETTTVATDSLEWNRPNTKANLRLFRKVAVGA